MSFQYLNIYGEQSDKCQFYILYFIQIFYEQGNQKNSEETG